MVDIETKPVSQKPFNRIGPLSGFAGQAAEVTGDILELAELQVKLARLDARDAVKRVVGPLGLIVFAGCMAIASLPVVFLGLAGGLSKLTSLEPWASQLIVGAVGVVIAVIVVALALRTLTTALDTFKRSTAELSKNVAWFKSIFSKT